MADESRVSALKDQLNLPENHASKAAIATKVAGSVSSSKQLENVAPIAGRSLPGEAAPGVPLFTFSKTSFSALGVSFRSTWFHQYLTNKTYRNLFGQEYCQGRKRVSKSEVKEAFEALTDEKKAVRFLWFFLTFFIYYNCQELAKLRKEKLEMKKGGAAPM